MLSKSRRAKEYTDYYRIIQDKEEELEEIQSKLDTLYLEPFKTLGIHANASYVLGGILRNPDMIYHSSTSLLLSGGYGMMFSHETLTQHIRKIFKHFKETGLLIKTVSGGFKLNPILKGLVKEKE